MSIESFCDRYPANLDLRHTVEEIRTGEGKLDRSLVVILAEQLIMEGRDGIREQLNRINPGNTMFAMDPRTFEQIPEEDKQKMFVNYNGIVFGILVCSIENTLIERKCSYSNLRERCNLAGLQFFEMPDGVEKREKFSSEQLRLMYSIAKQDKTLAKFIESEEGIQAMPAILREFVEQTGSLSIIRQKILPSWKERAKFVISS